MASAETEQDPVGLLSMEAFLPLIAPIYSQASSLHDVSGVPKGRSNSC